MVPARGGTEAWRRDRQAARCYFERARALHPGLEVPLLPPDGEDPPEPEVQEIKLKMPVIEVQPSDGAGSQVRRRRRQRDEETIIHTRHPAASDDIDSAWYLYVPGLVGAGTALLVVGVVGALSFSSWRKNQG